MPAYLHAQTAVQCENTKRTYADFQGAYLEGVGVNVFGVDVPLIVGQITNAGNAVNGQVKDASTLKVGVSALGLVASTQFLQFTQNGTPRLLPANTPVTIKISLPQEVLGLLGGLEIGSFTGLHPVSESWPLIGHSAGYDGSKTKIYDGTALVSALSGDGEVEITIKPGQQFNGVYVKVSSTLGVGMSANVFHAYIMEPTLEINCDEAIDVLSGVKPTIIGGVANFLGSVTNPFYAIDADTGTPAVMDAGLNVFSKVYLTTIFQKPSQKGDSVTIVFKNPGGTLLNLGLLNGFVIQPYLGNDKAGPAFEESNNFLNLSLFPGPGGTQIMTFPVSEQYDRLEIIMGGAADLLGKLNIYDIKRKLAKPRVLIDPVTTDKRTICEGEQTTFSVDNPQDCTTYKWYNVETNGTALATGLTYSPPTNLAAGEYNYYVEASRTYCITAVSERLKVTLKVKPYAPVSAIAGISTMCAGTSSTFTNAFAGGVWSTNDVTIATIDATGNVTAVAAGNVTISYTFADNVTYCGKKVDFNLTVNPQPNLTLELNPGICEGLITAKIAYSNPVSDPISYSIVWVSGPISNVSNQALLANEITINVPLNTPVAVYQGVLTVKNANGCERAIPFNFRVKLVPHKPTVSIN